MYHEYTDSSGRTRRQHNNGGRLFSEKPERPAAQAMGLKEELQKWQWLLMVRRERGDVAGMAEAEAEIERIQASTLIIAPKPDEGGGG